MNAPDAPVDKLLISQVAESAGDVSSHRGQLLIGYLALVLGVSARQKEVFQVTCNKI